MAGYKTKYGEAFCRDALLALDDLQDNSVDLVVTSPPFALLRKKEYGNESQEAYVNWLAQFARVVYAKLKDTGSFVVDIGGAYMPGIPSRSLYNFRVPIHFCDHLGFYLAEDFYWYNPSKLPSPIEWVNKRKIRVKDAVNNVWWFSKTPYPKSDVTKVLTPYSDRMKKLIENPEGFYTPKVRPSGHDIGGSFGKDNGGAIPPNLLQIANAESNSSYLSHCKNLKIKSHPARFPIQLPEFFIKMLTDENDLVIDIFGGSNTTGLACEQLKRRWLSFDSDQQYVAASALRFLPKESRIKDVASIYFSILDGKNIEIIDALTNKLENSPSVDRQIEELLEYLDQN
ncbi:DNA-methyltransferase [Niabella soli]|uniref:Methyltransferase n=1 Tax=Niabella soli DSM 19437 TaxID=929713 RepID=W0F091_9BACT|nr:site-specific DNA-methyltransferase [Niabella soli]AHF16475.1 DNA methyltransferase [Niabella soli DSM 19437]